MKLRNTILMTALSLLSALTVHTANAQVVTQAAKTASIPISVLPFSINAPGTYVLTGNLTSPITSYGFGAINIATAIAGPVIVDLKGFAITGPGPSESGGITIGVIIGINGSGVSNTYSITVRNGTIKNFGIGVQSLAVSHITMNNVVFDLPTTVDVIGIAGITFNNTSLSTISNCTFNLNGTTNGVTYGITDYLSAGGNSYNNDTFVNIFSPIVVQQPGASHLVLDRCQFAALPSN